MEKLKLLRNCFILIFIASALMVFSLPRAYAQGGNTISGYVFGAQRQPVANVDVELTDDYSRSVGRTQTNPSGRYIFSRVGSGKFRVRVMPYMTNYLEQIQEVEINNISRQSSNGRLITSGLDNTQCDFYLKLRKGADSPGINAVVFAQEVPKEAKSKYEAGLANIGANKNQEGLNNIKSAIEVFPNYFDALVLLGNEYIKLKHYVAANALLTKAVEVNPKSYKGWYGLAYANYSLNQTSEAATAIAKAVALYPEAVDAILLNGILLKQDKKYDESLVQLKKAKVIAKDSIPEINWQLALLYGNNFKQYDKAAEELEVFLKAQPDSKDSEMIKKLIKTFREKAQK
jgi:tetratricopeptide (TPR) repeat protein